VIRGATGFFAATAQASLRRFDSQRGSYSPYFGGERFVLPQNSNTAGTATMIGNSVWLDQRTITHPATVVESEGCLISYIAEYSVTKSN
jgi:hypothetical protein